MTGQRNTYKITSAGGVLQYRAVVQGANSGEVTLPAGANAPKFVGVTQAAQPGQNRGVSVQETERTFAVAMGAINAGDAVNIGDNTGKFASCQVSYSAEPGLDELVYCVGFARTAAALDGDIFQLQIQPHLVKTPPA